MDVETHNVSPQSRLAVSLMAPLAKFLDALPVPTVLRLVIGEDGIARLRVPMRAAWQRLHSQLPTSLLWTYRGAFPGPTIEVRRGVSVRVEWINELAGPYPVLEVTGTPQYAENSPGIPTGFVPDPVVAGLRAWTVVHLHGGRTQGASDGLPENAVGAGRSLLDEYHNDQRATMLWYHDHAMGITRLNVVAGLAGLYVIRDDEEDALGLPSGEFEVPLLLADRNLDLEADGSLSGRLLHKTEDGTAEFFAPFTTVNGVIWPHLHVQPRLYRLRVLNASNARVYRLLLVDEHGQPRHDAIRQIGTDGGLLGTPVTLPDGGLLLAPAERADLLVDFAALAGQHLELVNTAWAPFHNDPATPGLDPRQPDPNPDHRLPYPQVMQFRVGRQHHDRPVHDGDDGQRWPARLAGSYTRLTHDALPPDHQHRLVALVERPLTGNTTILQLWEIDDGTTVPAPTHAGDGQANAAAQDGIVDIGDEQGTITRHRRLSAGYLDTLNWRVTLDSWEIWKILNLTTDTHPFHVHLVQFQALARAAYDTSGFDPAQGGTTTPVVPDPGRSTPLDANELGDKDTIRVNPNEMVTIAARFSGGTGRYLYHCHILEHEDHDMMRPFLVAPADAMAASGMTPGEMPMQKR